MNCLLCLLLLLFVFIRFLVFPSARCCSAAAAAPLHCRPRSRVNKLSKPFCCFERSIAFLLALGVCGRLSVVFSFFFLVFAVVFFSVSFSSVVSRRDGHSVGRSSVGYRLNEHFHMKNQEAMTTTSIDMTRGLLSDDDDWPCCIAAGCSPDEQENNKGKILIYDCSLSI